MNDFTKEDLQHLTGLMDNFSATYGDEWNIPLRNKIQSMIDSYCEIKTPTMANYCCPKCNEEWHQCECANDKHSQIIEEFSQHGELSNNIKLLHYGCILLQSIKRLDCNLSDLLNAINEAAQQQIGEHNLGKTIEC